MSKVYNIDRTPDTCILFTFNGLRDARKVPVAVGDSDPNPIANDSETMQLAQCSFTGLTISDAKM